MPIDYTSEAFKKLSPAVRGGKETTRLKMISVSGVFEGHKKKVPRCKGLSCS